MINLILTVKPVLWGKIVCFVEFEETANKYTVHAVQNTKHQKFCYQEMFF